MLWTHKNAIRKALSFLAPLALLYAIPCDADSIYSVSPVGQLPGGTGSVVAAINAGGEITGSSGGQAFTFSAGSGIVGLGTLTGYQGSAGEAINAAGDVVGIAVGPMEEMAFLYAPKLGMTALGTLPGDTYSEAFGINSHGEIVGDSAPASNASLPQAFVYNRKGGVVGLGDLPGATYSSAKAVNNSGEVVGYSGGSCELGSPNCYQFSNGPGWRQPFVDIPGKGMIAIKVPGYAEADAINNLGQVLINSLDPTTGLEHAYIYTPGVGLVAIPSVLEDYSDATGINDKGQVVGSIIDACQIGSGDCYSTFLYQRGVLTAIDVDAAAVQAGFRIQGGVISDSGQIAAQSYNVFSNEGEAVILEPATPEPQPLLLTLVSGLVLVGGMKISQRR